MTPAQALWFGPPERLLLGFYHASAAPRSCAVVLCYPFAHEYTAVYKAYRCLAERLAAAGFSVLRFDYDGTGDSAGDDSDPGRLGAWLGSIGAAIDQVRQRSGAETVALIGLRLGATLAYLAAAHPSVSSLVLWAPSLTGKAYVREWKALRLLKGRPSDPAAGAGDIEAAGFLLSQQTVDELLGVELLTAPVPAATRVLLLARDGLMGEKRLADHLLAHGVAVDYKFIPGYATLVVEPYNAVVPDAVFAEMVASLAAAYPVSESARPAVHPSAGDGNALALRQLPQARVYESVVRFGPAEALLGILTEPSPEAAQPRRPALLLCNTSVIHRVGANRMYVPMARRWAAAGFPVLRMDLSGLGDSRLPGGRTERHMYSLDGVQDVRAAMDYLATTRGLTDFILIGLCSGAYPVFHAGLEDCRVVAEVMINPQTFEWKDGDTLDVDRALEYKSFRFYLKAALQKDTWARLLRGHVNLAGIVRGLGARLLKNTGTALRARVLSLGKNGPSENRVFAKFRQMAERGIQVYVIFSQEDPGLDEFALQLGKDVHRLPAFPSFKMELLDGPDHTFTSLCSQQRMEEAITTYVTRWQQP